MIFRFLQQLKLMDFIIIPGLLIFSIGIFIHQIILAPAGSKLIIIGPDDRMEYPLDTNREVQVNGLFGKSIIKIEKQSAFFSQSPCPHQYCVKMAPIDKVHMSNACLPNGVYIYIESEDEHEAKGHNHEIDVLSK